MATANTDVKVYTNKSNAIRAARKTLKLKEHEYTIEPTDGGFVIELTQTTPAETKAIKLDDQGRQIIQGHPWVRKSEIVKPTKQVWHVADEMHKANPEVSRKEVIAECIKRGIAFYTARTQYQLWLQCQKDMAIREAEQAKAKQTATA